MTELPHSLSWGGDETKAQISQFEAQTFFLLCEGNISLGMQYCKTKHQVASPEVSALIQIQTINTIHRKEHMPLERQVQN